MDDVDAVDDVTSFAAVDDDVDDVDAVDDVTWLKKKILVVVVDVTSLSALDVAEKNTISLSSPASSALDVVQMNREIMEVNREIMEIMEMIEINREQIVNQGHHKA